MGSTQSRSKPVDEGADVLRELNLLAEKLQSKQAMERHVNRIQGRRSNFLASTLAVFQNDKQPEIGSTFVAEQGENSPELNKSAIVRVTGDELVGIASFDEALDA